MTSVLIVGTLRATNRRASDGDQAHGSQVRVAQKGRQRVGEGRFPGPRRNTAPRCKVKRSPMGLIALQPVSARTAKGPASGQIAQLWVGRAAREELTTIGQAPSGPGPSSLPRQLTGFGASRWSMDSRAWNTTGPDLYLAVRKSPLRCRSDPARLDIKPLPRAPEDACKYGPSTALGLASDKLTLAHEGRPVACGFEDLHRTRPSPLILPCTKRTANSRPSAQVPLALRYTWHSPCGGTTKRTPPGGFPGRCGPPWL